jgi:hypothetical protein
MIVPKFWAEGRIQRKSAGKQITVRRFGWSDVSQADAQANADRRTAEALARIDRGEILDRRELKRAYNGAEGVPIREEVVERHGETVITRNNYGALCLNTPNVLFADIDFNAIPGAGLTWTVIALLLAAAVALGWWVHPGVGCFAAFWALVLGYFLAWWLSNLAIRFSGGYESGARKRIARFLSHHPDWHLRLYRTPAGLRIMVMHRTFDPREEEVAAFFHTIGTDPIYVRMCIRQNCFRARVSPKPWRIGIHKHLKPTGVWPVDPERLPERHRWIEEYERKAKGFASCRFLESVGGNVMNVTVLEVQRLHDELCQANRALEIA